MNFFRISERGTPSRPSLSAVIAAAIIFLISALVLRDHLIIFLIVSVFNWYGCAYFFSRPFRESIAIWLHRTRYAKCAALDDKVSEVRLNAYEKSLNGLGVQIKRRESIARGANSSKPEA